MYTEAKFRERKTDSRIGNGISTKGTGESKRTVSQHQSKSSRSITQYALSQEEAKEWLSADARVLDLSAKLDMEKQEKMLLMKRQETVEHNLHSVHTFLGNEKAALETIMNGARQKIAAANDKLSLALRELEMEREKNALLEQEMAVEREQSILMQQALKEAQQREGALRDVLVRQQVRSLYHIVCNIEYQRYMHFFSLWRKFTNDSQTLAAAEDLRRMTSDVDARASPPQEEYVESDHDEFDFRELASAEPDLTPLDVGSLDIYSMGAEMGLITRDEARSLSPDAKMSTAEASTMDLNDDGQIDPNEWQRLFDQKNGSERRTLSDNLSSSGVRHEVQPHRSPAHSTNNVAPDSGVDASDWHKMFSSARPTSSQRFNF